MADTDGTITSPPDGAKDTGPSRAGQDVLSLGIAFVAIMLFVGLGGRVLPMIAAANAGFGDGPGRLLATALLLNIALVILGWRHYAALTAKIREHSLAEEQARELAETDPLTGCLNRRAIGTATDQLIAQAHGHGQSTAFLMIDLDNFKQVNDLNGHATGDFVLQECTRRIAAQLPPSAMLARLGGDEFACAFAFDPASCDIIDKTAARILSAVSEQISTEAYVGHVSASVGITRSDAAFQPDTAAPDAAVLLHRADIAMYQAKKSGRNRSLWFEPAMEAELRYRGGLEAAIARGVESGEFVPYYERQIDPTSGSICGFEMLARWNSPEYGLVSPDIFIPIAEETGVIAALSEQLIAKALRDARSWAPHLTLSVNISPVQLRDPWFSQKLLRLLVAEGFPPSRLDVEITESCLHDNVGAVHALITSLRNQGVRISLDDFGTGYSSLSQLRALPFDRIKIDRSFVTSMRENADSATIVRTIFSLGEGLGLPVTAEGIETADVLSGLQELGEFKGQGYLYGRPQPADEVHELLATLNLLNQQDSATAPRAPRKSKPSGKARRRA